MKFWGNYLFCNYIVTGDGQVSWTKEKAVEMLGDFRGLSSRGYINSRYRAVSDRETVRAISARKAVMVYAGMCKSCLPKKCRYMEKTAEGTGCVRRLSH